MVNYFLIKDACVYVSANRKKERERNVLWIDRLNDSLKKITPKDLKLQSLTHLKPG